jgi:hypothetical protein
VNPLDHDCGVAGLHAGRAVADARVIGVDRGLAVLQALQMHGTDGSPSATLDLSVLLHLRNRLPLILRR